MSSGSTRADSAFVGLRGLGHRFADPALLEQALTHRSVGSHNNERLEFLGDAVLNLVIADRLYQRHEAASEGALSRLRSRLVRERTLAEVARELALGDALRMGPGELKSGGFLRDSILSDALEAVLGAVYLDAGFAAVERVIADLFDPRIEALPSADDLKDAKTRLQEWLQARALALPDYAVIEESGADHARRFTVRCRQPELGEQLATAGSRRKAEQAAARAMLEAIHPS
ncbi:MAG: ribonuclease III [Wenzhouxiangellaceae bacterium]|nr:ribonuclease III [Wenzhouxiangellaceae bacterium]